MVRSNAGYRYGNAPIFREVARITFHNINAFECVFYGFDFDYRVLQFSFRSNLCYQAVRLIVVAHGIKTALIAWQVRTYLISRQVMIAISYGHALLHGRIQ